jgi:hypothetical protein
MPCVHGRHAGGGVGSRLRILRLDCVQQRGTSRVQVAQIGHEPHAASRHGGLVVARRQEVEELEHAATQPGEARMAVGGAVGAPSGQRIYAGKLYYVKTKIYSRYMVLRIYRGCTVSTTVERTVVLTTTKVLRMRAVRYTMYIRTVLYRVSNARSVLTVSVSFRDLFQEFQALWHTCVVQSCAVSRAFS